MCRSLRSFVWLALFGAVVSLACVSGAVDDEIAEVCEDRCELVRDCGLSDEPQEQEACLADCVPLLKSLRNECLPDFELDRCWSGLSCEEAAAYAAGVDGYARTAVWPPSFPCREELMEKVRVCLDH